MGIKILDYKKQFNIIKKSDELEFLKGRILLVPIENDYRNKNDKNNRWLHVQDVIKITDIISERFSYFVITYK